MPVYYDSKSIIPGPFVQISKEFVRSEDGRLRRKFFALAVKGKLVSWAGSPRANGDWWTGGNANPPPNEVVPESGRLAAIKSKQGALVSLFNTSGRSFEIQPFDASAPVKCYPRVKNIEFPEGKWADTCDYSIQLEADNVWFGNVDGGGGISDVEPEESWSFEVAEDQRSYRVSHSVSSQQRASFDENGTIVKEGWENARDVVLPRTGTEPATALLPPLAQSGYLASNYSRSQQVDEGNGKFAISENWVYTYGQRYLEEFAVNTRTQEGSSHVSVEGTITGFIPPDPLLAPTSASAAKLAKALDVWQNLVMPNLLMRAQNYSGLTLNPLPLNKTVGYNPVKGVITYNWEYDNRPASMIDGSISEVISVQQQNPADIIAQLVVLGRPQGPILQSIGTVTAKVRSVSVEVAMPPWLYGTDMPSSPDATSMIMQFYPGSGYLTKDDENWNPKNGRYARNVAWTY